ncbi:hypothetical protein H6F51_14820 [Cyanobacteria bacterium FACHB-DQ100]|nr:hypothetical protein [Cyanobacteria bacterium FACHB-DQ100]
MKGKIKIVLAVLALPAIWALGAKTGKGKLFRWWLMLSLYYSPVTILKEIARDPRDSNNTTMISQPVDRGQLFADSFQGQIKARSAEGLRTEYASEVFSAWTNQLLNHSETFNAAFNNACAELQEFQGDANKAGSLAHSVNGYTRTLDQYVVYNQIKFDAAKQSGCTP